MLNVNDICADPERFRTQLADRVADPTVIDAVVELAVRRKRLLVEVEKKKRQQNEATRQIARVTDAADRDRLCQQARSISAGIKQEQAILNQSEAALEEALLALPNAPHASVPAGADETANIEVRRWGNPGSPVFQAQPHWEVGRPLGLDVGRGAKLAGSRFFVLKGPLAQLEMALIQFMIDVHVREHGYELVIPPFMVNRDAMFACGQLPKFHDELYRTQDEYYLVPTAESALASLHRDEILSCTDLPKYYVGYTPCFRREAGAAGRDTRGIMRVHQFNKVELFKFTTPGQSYDELETLVADAEAILQALGLPYRVVLLSAGDMGFAAAKTYDLEVWFPSQGGYREISSCSNVEAFQAHRSNTRYRPGPQEKPRYVHMLNGSGLAVGRTMIAILENYQRQNGVVRLPEPLRPYMGDIKGLVPETAETEVGSAMM
jgi:seryl-tRNA synthetase